MSAQTNPTSRTDDSLSFAQRASALARRLEAGDLTCYPEYEEMIMAHVWAISKPGHSSGKIGSGASMTVLSGHPSLSPLYIDNRSIFWASFEKTVRQDPNLNITNGMYSIWCFNTHPNQRELIFDMAKMVFMQGDKIVNTKPWHDLRFCIVMDWLYSWGDESDFVMVHDLLPKKAKSTFSSLYKGAKKLPGFFGTKLTLPKQAADIQKSIPSVLIDDVESISENDSVVLTDTITPSASENENENINETETKIFSVNARSLRLKRQSSPLRYPLEAATLRLTTELTLELLIGKDGIPKGCRPKPGPWLAFFVPDGVRYAMGWLFEPHTVNGEASESRFFLTLSFSLDAHPSMSGIFTLPTGRTPPRYIRF
jgi:hypothetical protein